MEHEPKSLDRFERAREAVWQLPGFERCQSTITAQGSAFFPGASWIIQTVITDDETVIFLEKIDSEGGQRLVLLTAVTKTIFRHYETIMKRRRSTRAKRGAESRKKKGTPLFGGKVKVQDDDQGPQGNVDN